MKDTTDRVNKVIVLGSGTSTGIPIIACRCHVCTHPDPRNKRLRSSILLKTSQGNHILVDAGPDIRTQLLREQVTRVDSLIITHDHADHCHGIDDLRPLSHHHPIPTYSDLRTAKVLSQKFPYIFLKKNAQTQDYLPQLNLFQPPEVPLEVGVLGPPCLIAGDTFEFFLSPHGSISTLSFVHQHKMAYIIDCHEIPSPMIEQLRKKQLDILIIDCARRSPHPTHLHLEKSLEYARAIAPRFCGLTHLGHDFEHNELDALLKKQAFSQKVSPLYDGQTLTYKLESHPVRARRSWR